MYSADPTKAFKKYTVLISIRYRYDTLPKQDSERKGIL